MTTATACAPRIAYMRYDPAGHLRFAGSAPVPGAWAAGKVISLDPRRPRRAALPVAAVPLPPAIEEPALRDALTDILADALVASHRRDNGLADTAIARYTRHSVGIFPEEGAHGSIAETLDHPETAGHP